MQSGWAKARFFNRCGENVPIVFIFKPRRFLWFPAYSTIIQYNNKLIKDKRAFSDFLIANEPG